MLSFVLIAVFSPGVAMTIASMLAPYITWDGHTV